jgi:hypothetical protein
MLLGQGPAAPRETRMTDDNKAAGLFLMYYY